MWLSTETIQNMKREWFSFDDVQKIGKTLDACKSWKMRLIPEEQCWKEIYSEMNIKLKQYHNA